MAVIIFFGCGIIGESVKKNMSACCLYTSYLKGFGHLTFFFKNAKIAVGDDIKDLFF